MAGDTFYFPGNSFSVPSSLAELKGRGEGLRAEVTMYVAPGGAPASGSMASLVRPRLGVAQNFRAGGNGSQHPAQYLSKEVRPYPGLRIPSFLLLGDLQHPVALHSPLPLPSLVHSWGAFLGDPQGTQPLFGMTCLSFS